MMTQRFKRVEAGLHTAQVGARSYELRKATFPTRFKWTLNETTRGRTRLVDPLIATVHAGDLALAFTVAVNEMMEKLGAEEEGRRQWVLQTRLGPLSITAGAHHVFMVFDDIELASAEIGRHDHFNALAGKWNMHWERGTSNWRMLLDFSRRLDRVTLKEA